MVKIAETRSLEAEYQVRLMTQPWEDRQAMSGIS
jgi:hypothetical protein